jgi:hypothetical protein
MDNINFRWILAYRARIHGSIFFMYMNILLTQIDMMFVEIGSDLIMTSILTSYYLRIYKQSNREFDNSDNLENL